MSATMMVLVVLVTRMAGRRPQTQGRSEEPQDGVPDAGCRRLAESCAQEQSLEDPSTSWLRVQTL